MKPAVYTTWGWDPPLSDREESVAVFMDYPDEIANPHAVDAYLKLFLQFEPPCVLDIIPRLRDDAINGVFDLVLAWHPAIVHSCPNAIYFQMCPTWMLGEKAFPNTLSMPMSSFPPYVPPQKDFSLGFVTSPKAWCPGHQLSQAVYDWLPEAIGDLKVRKGKGVPNKDSSGFLQKRLFLGPSQFAMAIENQAIEGWFTEKLVDCFIARTVPVYWGCPNLADYGFDAGGIVRFAGLDDLKLVLAGLTPETYGEMRGAMEHNRKRALYWADVIPRLDEQIGRALERKKYGKNRIW